MGKITTTVVGSYPRPEYLSTPDWFHQKEGLSSQDQVSRYNQYLSNLPKNYESQINCATKEVIQEQVNLGVDVVTDGELRRENYIYYLCRSLIGFDFEHLSQKSIRDEKFIINAPSIIQRIRHPGSSILAKEWMSAQNMSEHPVKITLPGPMTILDTCANLYYKDNETASQDLAQVINQEIHLLVKAGCQHIQIDEPLLARNPEISISYGIQHLEACFDGISQDDAQRILHICCGYPNRLDEDDYPKADHTSYFHLIPLLDLSPFIDAISIEDAHRRNPSQLFTLFSQTDIILGVIKIASSAVESVEEIKNHILQVIPYVTTNLIISPDCGLGMLPVEICQQKLANMTEAVRQINFEL